MPETTENTKVTRVSDLTGATLDLWVAKAEGLQLAEIHGEDDEAVVVYLHHDQPDDDGTWRTFMPSINWLDGGPMLARMLKDGFGVEYCGHPEGVTVSQYNNESCPRNGDWDLRECYFNHADPLVAICRARVAQVFGEEVPDAGT